MSDSPAAILYDSSGNELKGQKASTASLPVVVASDQSAVPISASALPLPTGASTSAKQPALGTAGSPSVDVISVQGVASGTVIPISGTVSTTVIPNPTDVTGTITTIGGAVTATLQGWSSCTTVITGTWTGSLCFQMSADSGTTWATGAFVIPPLSVFPTPGLSVIVTTNGTYQCIAMGAVTNVRIIAATAITGTVNVRLVFSNVPPQMLTAFTSMQQNVVVSTYNSSIVNLNASSSFTGTAESILGVNSIQVNIIADQPLDVKIQQSINGTNWDIIDTWNLYSAQNDSRSFQTTASFFRIVARNVGNATTTYFRLQTSLCPIAEPLPKSLTAGGNLRLSEKTRSWVPSPYNAPDMMSNSELYTDVIGNLCVRGQILTDEASFRTDFPGSTPYVDLTGTAYFVNGRLEVTGVGTAFLTQATDKSYLKLSSHADTVYMQVDYVMNDTLLYLVSVYTGATGNGTCRSSQWVPSVGTGSTITQTGSEIILTSGTTSGTLCQIRRVGDYLPFVLGAQVRIDNRRANQEAAFGFADADPAGTINNLAMVVLLGSDTNLQARFRTGGDNGTTQETIITLPNGATTATIAYWQIEVLANKCTLYYGDFRVAEHKSHIPGPYNNMDLRAYIRNTGTAAGTTVFAFDTIWLANYNRVNIGMDTRGEPIPTKEVRAANPVITSVAAAVANTLVLAANANRIGVAVYNDSIATLYLALGTTASTTVFTVALQRYDYYEIPFNYTGQINGYWSAATGSVRITEVTAT